MTQEAEKLTPMEQRIVTMVAVGFMDKQIAKKLGLTINAQRIALMRAKEKLGIPKDSPYNTRVLLAQRVWEEAQNAFS